MTFSSNIGSFETLNPCVRCGFSPASDRSAGNRSPGSISDPPHRPTLDGEMPNASAMVERLQWVALGGVSCIVFAITLRRVSRGSAGTREGRVLSRLRPSIPSSRKRPCQRQTVGFDVFARRMISLVPQPSAVASTIWARQTTLRAVFRSVSRA